MINYAHNTAQSRQLSRQSVFLSRGYSRGCVRAVMPHQKHKMKALKSILLVSLLSNIGCKKESDITPIIPCQPTTANYLSGKIFNQQACWEDNTQYEFGSAGTGSCGQGYENNSYQFMSLGVYITQKPVISDRFTGVLTIYIPFECDAFSTKEKFYNLLTNGQYKYLQAEEGYGQFIIKYQDRSGEYSTLNVSQGDNLVEILQVEPIPSPGPGTGIGQALRVKMKLTCLLADKNGKTYGKLEDVEVSGITYRQQPWGESWADWTE